MEEIIAVMRAAGDHAHGRRLRALIVILWRAGLRIQEALLLAEADLDQQRGALLVRRGKGGRRREVGMDAWGWEELRPWLELRVELPVGPLFCVISGPTHGQPWSSAAARAGLRRSAVQAGVRRSFASHQLRHAHAVELAREGVPLIVIQRQLACPMDRPSILRQGPVDGVDSRTCERRPQGWPTLMRNGRLRRGLPPRPRVALLRRGYPHDAEVGAADDDAFRWTVTDRLARVEPVISRPPAAKSTIDARGTPTLGVGGPREEETGRRRARSLLWWVFLANATVLVLALLLLTLSPITIDAPIQLEQFALLLAGFLVMLGLNLVLLRRVLSPLFRLTEVMAAIDPDRPGRRLSGVDPRSAEGQALAAAFNAMLDRLETARREAARTALAAQEAERTRVARELHDEIGQTLTAVTIQAERAAEGDPALAAEALSRVADAIRDSLDEVRRIARELRPEALDDLGLVNALIALCTRVGAQGDLRVRRELQGRLPELSRDVELVVYRIAQEALTNALRHSDAGAVTVSLTADAEELALRVVDRRPWDPATAPPPPRRA